jgi:hypothetical protein
MSQVIANPDVHKTPQLKIYDPPQNNVGYTEEELLDALDSHFAKQDAINKTIEDDTNMVDPNESIDDFCETDDACFDHDAESNEDLVHEIYTNNEEDITKFENRLSARRPRERWYARLFNVLSRKISSAFKHAAASNRPSLALEIIDDAKLEAAKKKAAKSNGLPPAQSKIVTTEEKKLVMTGKGRLSAAQAVTNIQERLKTKSGPKKIWIRDKNTNKAKTVKHVSEKDRDVYDIAMQYLACINAGVAVKNEAQINELREFDNNEKHFQDAEKDYWKYLKSVKAVPTKSVFIQGTRNASASAPAVSLTPAL